ALMPAAYPALRPISTTVASGASRRRAATVPSADALSATVRCHRTPSSPGPSEASRSARSRSLWYVTTTTATVCTLTSCRLLPAHPPAPGCRLLDNRDRQRAVPVARQRVRRRVDPLHHLVQDRLRVADPQVLCPRYPHDFGVRYRREPP